MISTLKKLEEKEMVFLGAEPLKGISKKSGEPYEIYNFSFADPETFENHVLSYPKAKNFSYLNKGDRVKLVLDLQAGWAGRNSTTLVVDAIPVK